MSFPHTRDVIVGLAPLSNKPAVGDAITLLQQYQSLCATFERQIENQRAELKNERELHSKALEQKETEVRTLLLGRIEEMEQYRAKAIELENKLTKIEALADPAVRAELVSRVMAQKLLAEAELVRLGALKSN